MRSLGVQIRRAAMIGCLPLLGSCTNLDEDVFGSLSPDNFPQNEEEALSALAGVYQALDGYGSGANLWRIIHLGTDEFIIAGRRDGRWVDGETYYPFIDHSWTSAPNVRIDAGWNEIFNHIGRANAVVDMLESSAQPEQFTAEIAEARALRAYAYFWAMDLFGQVPIFTDARVDPSNLPSNMDTDRSDVFMFVVNELRETAELLPSINDVNRTEYYPRLTREAAYGVLATAFLNAEVYTGEAMWEGESVWDLAADYAMRVMEAGAYVLEPEFVTNFVPDNHNSRELIIARSIDPTQNAGGNVFTLRALHDNLRFKYNLPFTPQNGFNTYEAVLQRYEENDIRREYILRGPQEDADGNPIPSLEDPNVQLVLIPHVDYTNSAQNEGFRVMKYQIDPNWVGNAGHHDFPLLRFADVLLVRAEALLRAGAVGGEALALVNRVRERSNATPLPTVTLADIEQERARELVWEGSRRRDMIRFGSYFTGTWKFKQGVTPDFMGVYPIPANQLDGNPNLRQNPGY
ncbi:MAG: RagB/SusD family nutrient uptake outer membrane protein [Longimicrobiales bacterium]